MWWYPQFMLSPAKIKREAKERSDKLREALEREVERSRVELKELSARLGRSDGYFTHLFKDRMTLTVEHVFAILLAIGVQPEEFLGSLYGTQAPPPAEEDFDTRVLRVMERYGIRPTERGDDKGGAEDR